MAYDFKFPDVGEGITEGTLVTWKVKVGDEIKVDDSIADVETDKATVGIPAPISGKVLELIGNEGDTLNVGDVFMRIDDGSATQDKTSEVETKINDSSFQIEEVDDVSKIKPQENNSAKDNTFYDVAQKKWVNRAIGTEKPITQAPIEEAKVSEDRAEHIQKVLSQTQEKEEVNPTTQTENKLTDIQDSEVIAMPNVKHVANLKGIDLTKVKGSGPNGRILLTDLDSSSVEKKEVEGSQNKEERESLVEEVHKEKEKISEEEVPEKEEIEYNSSSTHRIVATPSVRKLARELEVDINFVLGSGENGRINEDDIKRAKDLKDKKSQSNQQVTEEKTQKIEVQETQTKDHEDLHKEIISTISAGTSVDTSGSISFASGIRGAIAKNMMNSLHKTAQVTICEEVDVTELVELRAKEKETLAQQGVKLTYLPFFMKAFVEVARKFPKFNALLDDDKQELVLMNNFNLGIAVDTDKGLMVPVITNVQNKPIIDLAREVIELSLKARDGKLQMNEMQNGTFTISSVGSMAGQMFTPILNYPQAAILGIGRIIKKPVVKGLDHIDVSDMVTFSLTFDHRVIDGAEAAKFLKEFKEVLEDPLRLFMGM